MRSGADDVRCGALETLGNLAFCAANRPALLAAPGLRDWMGRLAQDKVLLPDADLGRVLSAHLPVCTA